MSDSLRPHGLQPTRLLHPWDFPGKSTRVGCHCPPWTPCYYCLVASFCLTLFAIPWTVAHQVPLSIEFSRQEYWSRLPFPSPGDLPNPGIEPGSSALQTDALPYVLTTKPCPLGPYLPVTTTCSFFSFSELDFQKQLCMFIH